MNSAKILGPGGPPKSLLLENVYESASNDPEVSQAWVYTNALSYAPGDTMSFHLNASAPEVVIEIMRDGASLETVHHETVKAAFFETPLDCSVAGCGWPVGYEIVVPADWRSGGYRVRVTAEEADGTTFSSDHWFALRSGEGQEKARILQIAATSTWLAYNNWGGSNHYEGILGPNHDQFATSVSTQRPWARGFCWLPDGAPRSTLKEPPPFNTPPRYPRVEWAHLHGFSKKYGSAGWASYDRHFAGWSERNGFAVDMATQHDLHYRPEILEDYDCVVIVGHDEYWSWEMRDAIDTYVEAGGHLARFGGNFLWQIRLEDEGRHQVCYKYRARDEDPIRETEDSQLMTGAWEDPIVSRPGATTVGLNGLRGVYAHFGHCVPRGPGGFIVYRPDHWVFAGADVFYGDVLGGPSRIFGYEVDGLDYTVRDGLVFPTHQDGAPDSVEVLAMGLATCIEDDHGHQGSEFFIGDMDGVFAAEILYGATTPEAVERTRRGSGMIVTMTKGKGEVFNAGTCEWVNGLIQHDPQVEAVTRNVLARAIGDGSP